LETIDAFGSTIQNGAKMARVLLLEVKLDARTPFFVEPDGIRGAGITQALVTMKVTSIELIEKMA